VDDDLLAPQALTNHLVIFKTRLMPSRPSLRVLMPELLDEGYSVSWASYGLTPATPERLHRSCRRRNRTQPLPTTARRILLLSSPNPRNAAQPTMSARRLNWVYA
jgi:hypothetical protein